MKVKEHSPWWTNHYTPPDSFESLVGENLNMALSEVPERTNYMP